MVICKYFQQGNCRFGQYCKYEHSYGNRTKTFGDDKNIALFVAEEVLLAERGGQWLLSCYGPFKEKKCIPGMEDVSPEEVRWEMYQAQKNNNVDQVNANFQQMCESMKVKRDALKNPTPAIVQLLEEINSGSENANKGNFAFASPQLGNQSTSVFGQKPFGTTSNPFGGGNTFNSTQSSIFGRTATNNATSVFGGKPTFGSSSVFGTTPNTGTSIFSGSNTAAAPFSTVQSAPSFGGLVSQGNSIFGGGSQSTFGQPAAFGTSNVQSSNSFLKPQTAQTSIFGGASTTLQNNNVFGGNNANTAGATNSVFGTVTTTSTAGGSGIFGQSTTATAAFGGAPVFGGPTGFGAAQSPASGSVFGAQSTFGAGTTVSSSNNVFGGSNAANTSFGALSQGTAANAFGCATVPVTGNAFEAAPNAAPFAAPISTAATPFGTNSTTANPAFATSTTTGPFGTAAKTSTFGFATPQTNTTNAFGITTATTTAQTPFGGNAFGNTQVNNNVFANPTTATNTPASNPFMAKMQPNTNSPFGTAATIQPSPFNTFVKSENSYAISLTVTIDETAYTADNCLTDDEKAAYQMAQFIDGCIPLKPPSKELR